MKAEPALEFSDLFRTDNVDDGLEVPENEFGLIPDPAHPFEKLFSPLGLRTVEDFGWDELMTVPLSNTFGSDCFSNPLGLSKSSVGYKLRVTRIEEKEIGGENWIYAYSGNELVDARVVCE